MQRFVLKQNIAHFEKLLSESADEGSRRTLQALLLSAQSQLAVLESEKSGTERTDIAAGVQRNSAS